VSVRRGRWIARSTYTVGVAFGALFGWVEATEGFDGGSRDWPDAASQVFVTLLLALVIEGDRLPVPGTLLDRWMARLLGLATGWAVLTSVAVAASGQSFSTVRSGIVLGVMVALVWVLGTAVWRAVSANRT
jgi:hypothetical protein